MHNRCYDDINNMYFLLKFFYKPKAVIKKTINFLKFIGIELQQKDYKNSLTKKNAK